jgi:hypothetical protein
VGRSQWLKAELYIAQGNSRVDRLKTAKHPERRIDEFAFPEAERAEVSRRNDLELSAFPV